MEVAGLSLPHLKKFILSKDITCVASQKRRRGDYLMEVVRDLTCPICLEFFTHPIILPCSHVLCRRPCAENLFDINFIRCPVCRDNCFVSGGITSLPRVITLESIIEKVSAERKQRKSENSESNDDDDIIPPASPSTSSTLSSSASTIATTTSLPQRELRQEAPLLSPLLSPTVSSIVCDDQSTPRSVGDQTLSSNHVSLHMPWISTQSPRRFSQHTIPSVSLDEMLARTIANSYNRNSFSSNRSDVSDSYSIPMLSTDLDLGTNTTNRIHASSISASSSLFNDTHSTTSVGRSINMSPRHSSQNTPPSTFDLETVLCIKREIQSQLQKLCDVQCQLLVYLTSYRDKAERVKASLDKHRNSIMAQCDELVSVVETKRSTFLERVDRECEISRDETDDVTAATESLLTSTQQLACFAEQILKAKHEVLLESAPAILDRLSASVKDCQACLVASEPRFRNILTHTVDLRNEREVLAGMGYLTVPSRPVINVEKCTRNTDTVALVIKCPSFRDVIDSYEVMYCSAEQKRLGIEERYFARVPCEHRFTSNGHTVILIENLCRGSHYYFCTCAVNAEGRSPYSEFVQCVTLSPQECVVPVPRILESSCQAESTTITVTCPSPTTVTACQGVSHMLLTRPGGGASVWAGHEMSEREEHSVSNLSPMTDYEVAVVAWNGRGECQISEKLSLTTTRL